MKKKDFEKLETALKERGYRKSLKLMLWDDYVWMLSLHKEDGRRAECFLMLCVYDNTLHPEWHDRMPDEERKNVRIEIHVLVSRVANERMEFVTAWADDMTIEEVECLADSFYRWVSTAYPKPRKVY